MSAEIPAARVRLIDRIILAARGMTRKAGGTDSKSFLKSYFMGVAQEDLMAQKAHFYMKSTVIYAKKPETSA